METKEAIIDLEISSLSPNSFPAHSETEMQGLFDQTMRDYQTYLENEQRKIKKTNKRIFKLIKKVNGEYFLRCLKKYLYTDGCLNIGKIELTSKPSGDYQKESGFGKIKGLWVDQWTTGSCDSYAGHIYVLVRGTWIES